MQAPDVAITEAAIGAAISTIFFLVTIRSVGTSEDTPRKHRFLAVTVLSLLTITLLSIIPEIPEYGASNTMANAGTSAAYLTDSYTKTGIPNFVTAVLGSYRSVDTLGEVFVILSAAFSIMLILPSKAELLTQKRKEKKNAT